MTPTTLILLSELWQIGEIGALASGEIIVALDAEVEEALDARGLPYTSGKDYRSGEDLQCAANEWAVSLLENPAQPFATYRGVSLGHAYFYPVYLYCSRLAYTLDIVASLVERYEHVQKIVVFPPALHVSKTMADLTEEEIHILVDCVHMVGAQKHIAVEVRKKPDTAHVSSTVFQLKRSLYGVVLLVWNMLIRIRPSRRVRMLVNDYWRNIAPLTSYLTDAELVYIDRLEALNAGISAMWKWRMRFYHVDHFKRINTVPSLEATVLPHGHLHSYSVESFLVALRDAIVKKYMPGAIRDIDATYAMLQKLRPSVVELRVSTSPQRNYSILAQVSTMLSIPSVEFQHGLEYNGVQSFTRRKMAHYIGTYGPLINDELHAAGIGPERTETIGSPRFDVYAQAHRVRETRERSETLEVVCVHPDLSFGDGFDTYDMDQYMADVAAALRGMPHMHLTIKLRGTRREAYFRRRIAHYCGGISYTIERDTPLSELFKTADICISCYSTSIIEAMQSGVATIVFGTIPVERRIIRAHFGPYVEAGAVSVAEDSAALATAVHALSAREARQSMTRSADAFLAKQFVFDGRAAERAAAFIEKLARR